ncbi:MAG: hypothetical protein JWL58_4669 [Streptosporangiaceae bacterium]|nr:hypothetical protein [Streptosporangiaceae bacterium]
MGFTLVDATRGQRWGLGRVAGNPLPGDPTGRRLGSVGFSFAAVMGVGEHGRGPSPALAQSVLTLGLLGQLRAQVTVKAHGQRAGETGVDLGVGQHTPARRHQRARLAVPAA